MNLELILARRHKIVDVVTVMNSIMTAFRATGTAVMVGVTFKIIGTAVGQIVINFKMALFPLAILVLVIQVPFAKNINMIAMLNGDFSRIGADLAEVVTAFMRLILETLALCHPNVPLFFSPD